MVKRHVMLIIYLMTFVGFVLQRFITVDQFIGAAMITAISVQWSGEVWTLFLAYMRIYVHVIISVSGVWWQLTGYINWIEVKKIRSLAFMIYNFQSFLVQVLSLVSYGSFWRGNITNSWFSATLLSIIITKTSFGIFTFYHDTKQDLK